MRKLSCFLLALLFASTALAATTRNDDSCDVAVMPAATLLLPYFEVELDDREGETTLLTIANVSNFETVARVTLWTDRAYPVFTFNVHLTGYDVQALNLYDVLATGRIDHGWMWQPSKRGKYSDSRSGLEVTNCVRNEPEQLAEPIVARMQSAFTNGWIEGECSNIGGTHDHAVGYATIDVVADCSLTGPGDPAYWSEDLRYDNVLTGDYLQVHSRENFAQGGPLVHVRAIPEGGTPRERRSSSAKYGAGFPRTFYARYQSALHPDLDGRQPLPSQFATRWIQGGANDMTTSLKIWREGRADTSAPCAAYAADDSLNVREIVTFDEQENAVGAERLDLPATSRTSVDDAAVYPQTANGATSGWMYLNLDRSARDDDASQAWVISSMRAEARYSTDVEAIAMSNGCSAPAAPSRVTRIAPKNDDDSCDVAALPAATLLLPYFEVDLDDPRGETTLFTITNVSPRDQIARVTLWTDYAFPVLALNIPLAGYDVQSINLYDVIEKGVIGVRPQSHFGCAPGQLSDSYILRMQSAFLEGTVPDLGDLAGCNNVGNEHDNAVGYATIDVVRNCAPTLPTSADYWTNDVAWDNVLIGDYQQVNSVNNFAQGSPMVHVRAVPEGGTAAERLALPRKYDAGFPRTFYSRYQPAHAPKLDGRQPLPSVFAARWIQGGVSGFRTFLKIWRQGKTRGAASCATHDDNVAVVGEIVTLDEAENAVGDVPVSRVTPITTEFTLPATSRTSVHDASIYPQLGNGAISGWVYLNLRNDREPVASSNWVVASMHAEGRYSVALDATALGNGCSAATPVSEVTTGTEIIGPRP